jgi:hypothetical protein
MFTGDQAAEFQTSFDALPHPDDRVFTDEQGHFLDLNLFDPAVWKRFAIGSFAASPQLSAKLERARQFHHALARATPPSDAIVIGARHLPTPTRMLVSSGRVQIPPPKPRENDPWIGFTYSPGDGELPESSLRSLPGLDEHRLWFVTPSAHHRLPSDPGVHRMVLEGLLATDRHIPTTLLSRNQASLAEARLKQ